MVPGRHGVLGGGVRGGRTAARRPGAEGGSGAPCEGCVGEQRAVLPASTRAGGGREAGQGRGAARSEPSAELTRELTARETVPSPWRVGERCSEGTFQPPGHCHAVPTSPSTKGRDPSTLPRLWPPGRCSPPVQRSFPPLYPRDTPDPTYPGSSCTW